MRNISPVKKIRRVIEVETKVINKYSGKPFDLYIARGNTWENPFTHLNVSSNELL